MTGPGPRPVKGDAADRRAEVARLAAEGLGRNAIAARLGVRRDTVSDDAAALGIVWGSFPSPSAGAGRRVHASERRRAVVAKALDLADRTLDAADPSKPSDVRAAVIAAAVAVDKSILVSPGHDAARAHVLSVFDALAVAVAAESVPLDVDPGTAEVATERNTEHD